MPILNKDMQVCISLAARPSNIGTRFHNFLYDELGLNFIYKGFSTTDIKGAIQGVRALNIRGCAISMPFKEEVIALIDEMMPSASAIESVNTIVNDNGVLKAYNTDYQAVVDALANHNVMSEKSVVVRGSGGMAKAVVAALKNANFQDVTIASRNQTTGQRLADKYGYLWISEDELDSIPHKNVLVNITPIGMKGANENDLAFSEELISDAEIIFDVVADPFETPLIKAARAKNKEVITGLEIMASQAAIQFELYTGVALTRDQVKRASEFSRLSQ